MAAPPTALVALAAALAAVAVLGPLVTGTIRYRYTETMLNQATGLDAFALFVVAPIALAAAVLSFRAHPAAGRHPPGPRGVRRRRDVPVERFVGAMADFAAFIADRAATSEYEEHPTAYWIVAFLDLAVVVPLTVATGVALLRRRPWAQRAFYGVIAWFALVPGSVAAMALTMVVRDDPAADPGKAVVFAVAAVVGLALGAFVFMAPAMHRGFAGADGAQ